MMALPCRARVMSTIQIGEIVTAGENNTIQIERRNILGHILNYVGQWYRHEI